jgi:hypothetical protein
MSSIAHITPAASFYRGSMMKTTFALALLMIAGCSSSAPDRSARTASTLDTLQHNASTARMQIDAVSASLDTLLTAPPDGLRKAFDRYASDVKNVNDNAAAIREHDADLQKNGNAYLNQWQRDAASVSDAELRGIAEQRQSEIADKTRGMKATVSSAAQSFAAYLRDVNDIRKVIGNDLTPTGQNSVKNTAVAQSAQQEGVQVKAALKNAEDAIAELRAQITPTAK